MSPRSPRQFWLFKSEPDVFSIDDLARAPRQTTCWDGVRNYQARNFLRDSIQIGDGVLFYHSSSDPLAIVGTARVVRAGYADQTAFDPKNPHFDPKSDPADPTWYMVDIQLETIFSEPLRREQLQKSPALKTMMLLQRGSRLSVQPVSAAEWQTILRLAGVAKE
jgi:predicted RNA-binding protein with PUA-like domain